MLVSVGAATGVHEPSEDAIGAWRKLWTQYDDAGIELLDWFLVEGTWARSMAETAGYDSGW